MAILSTGVGRALGRARTQRAFARLVPVFGMFSLAFGTWYALGALTVVPYAF
jgi:hypothetical protein